MKSVLKWLFRLPIGILISPLLLLMGLWGCFIFLLTFYIDMADFGDIKKAIKKAHRTALKEFGYDYV